MYNESKIFQNNQYSRRRKKHLKKKTKIRKHIKRKLIEKHSFYEQALKDFKIVDNAYLRYKNSLIQEK